MVKHLLLCSVVNAAGQHHWTILLPAVGEVLMPVREHVVSVGERLSGCGAQVLPGKGAVSAARAKLLQAHYKTPGAASAAAAATAASNAAGETICTRNYSCADATVIIQHMHTRDLTPVHGQAADAGAGQLVLSCRLCYARCSVFQGRHAEVYFLLVCSGGSRLDTIRTAQRAARCSPLPMPSCALPRMRAQNLFPTRRLKRLFAYMRCVNV